MWTDYLRFGPQEQQACMRECAVRLNDHRRIRHGADDFTPARALARHWVSRAWLAAQVATPFEGSTVVVTHHGCHWSSVGPRWREERTSAGFSSDLNDLLAHADLWVHGHTHDSHDYRIGRCRVVVNPRGYPQRRGGHGNSEAHMQCVARPTKKPAPVTVQALCLPLFPKTLDFVKMIMIRSSGNVYMQRSILQAKKKPAVARTAGNPSSGKEERRQP